jgi:hypothetical protein
MINKLVRKNSSAFKISFIEKVLFNYFIFFKSGFSSIQRHITPATQPSDSDSVKILSFSIMKILAIIAIYKRDQVRMIQSFNLFFAYKPAII